MASPEWTTKRRRALARIEIIDGRPTSPVGTHGTATCYANHCCRCALCTEANRVRQAEGNRRRHQLTRDNGGVAPGARKHGASVYANWGCRCEVCVGDWIARGYGGGRQRATQNKQAQSVSC